MKLKKNITSEWRDEQFTRKRGACCLSWSLFVLGLSEWEKWDEAFCQCVNASYFAIKAMSKNCKTCIYSHSLGIKGKDKYLLRNCLLDVKESLYKFYFSYFGHSWPLIAINIDDIELRTNKKKAIWLFVAYHIQCYCLDYLFFWIFRQYYYIYIFVLGLVLTKPLLVLLIVQFIVLKTYMLQVIRFSRTLNFI